MSFLPPKDTAPESADILIVGSGFASSFFLHRYLQDAPDDIRIVVLERGTYRDHAQIVEDRHRPQDRSDYYRSAGASPRPWAFTMGFGGSSNCWWGNAPRMIPSDFQTKSRFGVGMDWPFTYDALEPYYTEAERIMEISGGAFPAPMSAPYPLPAHRQNSPGMMLAEAWPGQYFDMPTARANFGAKSRGVCCANGVCNRCPVDAKFTILNGLHSAYDDPRVTVIVEAPVLSLDIVGGQARGAVYQRNGRTERIAADHTVLGANALFNPEILLRSGDSSALTGRRLHEQQGVFANIMLDGVDGFQGTTSVTGLGTMLWDDDERRKTRAPALIEVWNTGTMRNEPGRWLQKLSVRIVYEDLPEERNHVQIDPDNPAQPVAIFDGISDYTRRATDRVMEDIDTVFAALPVDYVTDVKLEVTEAHIQGTTVMGTDPATSVVDQDGLHYQWRDVRVLGASTFPTGSPANPTLTLSAHALRAAERMVSS